MINVRTQLQDVIKTQIMDESIIEKIVNDASRVVESEKDIDLFEMSGHYCFKYGAAVTPEVVDGVRKVIAKYVTGDKVYSRVGITVSPSEHDIINERTILGIISDIKKDNVLIFPTSLKASLQTEEYQQHADVADDGTLFGSRKHANRSVIIVGLTLIKKTEESATFRIMISQQFFDGVAAKVKEVITTYDYPLMEENGLFTVKIMKPLQNKLTLPLFLMDELTNKLNEMSRRLLRSYKHTVDLNQMFIDTELVVDPIVFNTLLVKEYTTQGTGDTSRKSRYPNVVKESHATRKNDKVKKLKGNIKPARQVVTQQVNAEVEPQANVDMVAAI